MIIVNIICLILIYLLLVIYIYIKYKSKRIKKLKGGFIYENYNLLYILNIIIMKIGIFGYMFPIFFNRIIYNYIAKKTIKKYNKKFKDDEDCKTTIIQYMIDYKFNTQQIYELENKELNTKNYPNMNSFILRDIDMKERNNIFNKKYFYSPVDSRTTFIQINKKNTKIISRITFSDYKKIHSPIDGKIISIVDKINDFNYPICDLFLYKTNSRKIITIQYNNKTIEMTLICGCLCDIVFNKEINDYIKIGEELGFFTSEACIITNVHIKLLDNIEYGKEYYINVKDKLGELL